MSIVFGRGLRPRWHLDPEGSFLNHGSYGACPREVLAVQTGIREEMERQPDVFFRRTVHPERVGSRVRAAAEKLAQFVGTTGERLAFVANATEAVNAVLASIDLGAGDEVLVLDCVYGAVKRSVEYRCGRAGARLVRVPLPLPVEPDAVVPRILAAPDARTRIAILDHIASPTAVLLPVREIVAALKARGVAVLIDGAHAPGQIALDVEAIGADWYTGNAHKWLYAPKGAAFLHASEEVAKSTLPLVVSHYHGLGFPRAFDYTGTADKSAWLAVSAGIDFLESMDADAARAYMADLVQRGTASMASLDARPVAPASMNAAMRAFVLPQRRAAEPADAQELMSRLWDVDRIQLMSVVFEGRLLVRFSAQVYVEDADFARAIEALERNGWPGR